jgi:hypothetical protein
MIVHFAGIDACEVELVDRPITQMLCRLHQINSQNCEYWTRKGSIIQHRDIIDAQFDEVYEQAPCEINAAIDRIYQITGYSWPIRAFPGMDFAETNALHRLFTTGIATLRASLIDNRSRDRIFEYKIKNFPAENWLRLHLTDKQFGLNPNYPELHGYDLEEFKHQLEIINAAIHRYEDACLVSQRSNMLYNIWGGERLNQIFDVAWDERNLDGIPVNPVVQAYPLQNPDQLSEFDRDTDILEDLINETQTDPVYDVYAMKCIIGKSYMLAWNEYDDPRAWDVTRTQTISGAFTLDPHKITNQFYNSDIFHNWLTEYNHPIDPRIYGHIPAGKIVNGWGLSQIAQTPPYMVFKKPSECVRDMQSELNRICDEWTVTKVTFER